MQDLKDYKFWRKLYLDTMEKLNECSREHQKLNEWAQGLFAELNEYKQRERKDAEELDRWSERKQAEFPLR